MKILIVDDEPDILEFLKYNFTKAGFRVQTASNGKEALVKVKEEIPTVIVSDILMPEMDGIAMCKELRKEEQFRNIPLIFLTAVTDDYKVLHAMTSGADQFISKPIKFESLLKMVNQFLELKKA
ncbi:MAG TPA: response regulator [Bacteroidia bacterium]|nr:response regulator [Bacteroidia bacterium]